MYYVCIQLIILNRVCFDFKVVENIDTMPRKKKTNIGRKNLKTKNINKIRKNATPYELNCDKISAKNRMKTLRANESTAQYEYRCEKDRLTHKALRSTEKLEMRAIRMESDRLAHHISRASETTNERKIRHETDRLSHKIARTLESQDITKARLLKCRERASTSRKAMWSDLNLEAFNYNKSLNYKYV